MMFLIIFGLRGFKHHIQSQIALRCAWEIKNTLTKFDHVISASVGVTTGKSYCGVVGYQKRQEYSVISMTVNVAARLMMAYPGKVTCDKKTYISSYLPVANFKNEETKVLKGLQNVGAIYEFVEISDRIPINLTPDESRPCLYGRKDNLKIYEKRLKHAMEISKSINQTQQNVILIVGKTGEGKSYLLDEMFACTQNHGINSFKITAHIENTRIPFGLTFHYMSTLMGLSKDANSIRRELLISELLDEYKINQLYFTLNPVLKVNFKVPEIVPLNVHESIGEIQSRLFKILCRKLIQDFWVIFIDDIEFADEESILLLNHVFEVLQLFFVITTGTKRKLSVHAAKILTQFNIKPMVLEPIDRVIQKTLACNFLKVEAIDIDIERAINLNSHGNPGWIERFLTSLTMDGLIQIEEVSLVDAKHKGLVFIDDNKDDNENFISTSSFHCDEYDNENELNKYIKIANLSPDAHMEHLELEYTEDIDFIILYDSLTSFEQQILKCCSVLGRSFLRSTILYLLRENERKISLGIKHLVELGILSCGGGMSLHGNAYVQRQTKSTELDTVCVCSNLQIIESCKDLPRYANCGFMKFKSEQIMTTSYELLTDHQKKEYHKKILSYLENESKRCEACGGSYFESLQYFKRNILPEIEVQITQNLIFANDRSERFLNESFSVVNQKRENKPGVADSKLGLKMHFNKITPKQLTLPIGNISNAMCECNMILYLTFQDMVRHAKGADLQRKILETMMQHIEICIEVENYVRALCISEELQKFIETKYEFKKKEHEVYFMARFYTFKGVCYSSLNQIDAAREHFNMACNFLKLNIPKSWEINGWLAVWLVWRATRFLRKKSYGARTASVSVIYEQVTMQIIDTSMALSNFFKKTRELYLGVTVAALALYKVVRYSHNYTLIIKCYANFIDVGNYGFN
uniref:CSON004959 protein n=1 Tax=Culicoides sonorensis TaxID=179676 RepID=A0A336MUG3_CULSO